MGIIKSPKVIEMRVHKILNTLNNSYDYCIIKGQVISVPRFLNDLMKNQYDEIGRIHAWKVEKELLKLINKKEVTFKNSFSVYGFESFQYMQDLYQREEEQKRAWQ